MCLFIPSHGELGHVGDERTAADFDDRRLIAATALFAFFEDEIMNISDEVDVPYLLSVVRSFSFEIVRFAVKSVAKYVRTIEDKILIVQKVHHEWRRGKRNISRRLVAA